MPAWLPSVLAGRAIGGLGMSIMFVGFTTVLQAAQAREALRHGHPRIMSDQDRVALCS
jgi:hypothetical protein